MFPVPSIPFARHAAVLLAAALVLSSVAAAPATARAPPWPVCGPCADGALAAAAADRGVDVTTGDATLDVQVFANGSTRWTARIELTDGAEAMANDSLRRAVVAGTVRADYRDLSTRMGGGTLVVTYRRPDAAERSAGAALFTSLHASGPPIQFPIGGEGAPYRAADALTIHAPDGYVLAGGTDGGDTSRSAVRWTVGDGRRVSGDAVPTFVPEDAFAPDARGTVARVAAGYW